MPDLGPIQRRTAQRRTAVGRTWGVLGVTALTVAVNVLLGYLSLLPAMYASYAISDLLGVPPYTSDPDVARAVGYAGTALVVGGFVAVNALLHRFVPGRPWWIWPVALAAYPCAFLTEVWTPR